MAHLSNLDILAEHLPYILRRNDGSEMYKYLEAHDLELEDIKADIEYLLASRQIDNATEGDLDQLGTYYGPLGNRNGRTDPEYRQYLKSISKSFSGRGTVPGIKFAISGGLNIDAETITVVEHFDTLENSIYVTNWEAHDAGFIEDMFNIAKPSVVQLRKPVRYNLGDGKDNTLVMSSAGVKTGNQDAGLGSGTIGDNQVGYYVNN